MACVDTHLLDQPLVKPGALGGQVEHWFSKEAGEVGVNEVLMALKCMEEWSSTSNLSKEAEAVDVLMQGCKACEHRTQHQHRTR